MQSARRHKASNDRGASQARDFSFPLNNSRQHGDMTKVSLLHTTTAVNMAHQTRAAPKQFSTPLRHVSARLNNITQVICTRAQRTVL